MSDYLLDAKDFASLREYMSFLSDLPGALAEIKRFSDDFQRSGHVLMTPPDAQALTRAAIANEGRWRAIAMVVPSLSTMGCQLVAQTATFLAELEQVAQGATGPARRQPLGTVDPLRFTPINAGSQGTNRPPDVLYLINNLCLRLNQCAKVTAHFKSLIVEVSQTIHRIFVRFIESLALRLCVCDAPVSKIEAYYSLGRIALPNMQYDPAQQHSQAQRRAKANEHLKVLNGLYARAISAGNNFADFCHRMNYFLVCMKDELQSNDQHCSLRRARSSMAQLAYPLEELSQMVDALIDMSARLKA